jgi:hypothetical protein
VSGGRDPFEWLPDELIVMIMLMLPFEVLWSGVCERVCLQWARLTESASVKRRKRDGRWAAYEAGLIKPRELEDWQQIGLRLLCHRAKVHCSHPRGVGRGGRTVACPPLPSSVAQPSQLQQLQRVERRARRRQRGVQEDGSKHEPSRAARLRA